MERTKRFFASGGQSIGASASASVLPVNIQGGFLWTTQCLASRLGKALCGPEIWKVCSGWRWIEQGGVWFQVSDKTNRVPSSELFPAKSCSRPYFSASCEKQYFGHLPTQHCDICQGAWWPWSLMSPKEWVWSHYRVNETDYTVEWTDSSRFWNPKELSLETTLSAAANSGTEAGKSTPCNARHWLWTTVRFDREPGDETRKGFMSLKERLCHMALFPPEADPAAQSISWVPHQMWDLMTWLCHPYLTSARPGRSSCRHMREVIWAKSRIHPVFSVSVGDCFFNSLGSFFNL